MQGRDTWVNKDTLQQFKLVMFQLVGFHEQFAKGKYHQVFLSTISPLKTLLDLMFQPQAPEGVSVLISTLTGNIETAADTLAFIKEGAEKQTDFLKIYGQLKVMINDFKKTIGDCVPKVEIDALLSGINKPPSYTYEPIQDNSNHPVGLKITENKDTFHKTNGDEIIVEMSEESDKPLIINYDQKYDKETFQNLIDQLKIEPPTQTNFFSFFKQTAHHAPTLTTIALFQATVALAIFLMYGVTKKWGPQIDEWLHQEKTGVGHEMAIVISFSLLSLIFFTAAFIKTQKATQLSEEDEKERSTPFLFKR